MPPFPALISDPCAQPTPSQTILLDNNRGRGGGGSRQSGTQQISTRNELWKSPRIFGFLRISCIFVCKQSREGYCAGQEFGTRLEEKNVRRLFPPAFFLGIPGVAFFLFFRGFWTVSLEGREKPCKCVFFFEGWGADGGKTLHFLTYLKETRDFAPLQYIDENIR